MACVYSGGRPVGPRHGAAVVEFAVIVALICAAALLTCSVLGDRVHSSLSRLGHSVPAAPATSAPTAIGPAERGEPAALASPAPAPTEQANQETRLANQRWLAGVTCVVAAVALYVVRRRVRRPAAGPHSLPRADELIEKRQKLLLVLQKHLQRAHNAELSVRQLMSHRLVVVRPNATVDKIRHFMQTERVRHVLVCQGQTRLVGVISDRDVSQRSGGTAADIMTPDPLSVRPDTPLIAAATTILNRGISCLPVVEDDRLCGVLTTTDLVLGLQATLQLLQKLVSQPDWSGATSA